VIDSRADIHPAAKLGSNVTVGPWTLIDANVEIGDGSVIGPHVVIRGPTKIGKNNQIFQFASVGEDTQDKKYKKGEETYLEIGDNNVIRECVTINRGTVQGGGITSIGNDNLLMAYVHIAHDCKIANHTIFANYVGLAGHVTVQDYVGFGGYAAVHQFCTVGAHAFVGKASMVTQDVLPYVLVSGSDPVACGLNAIGLKRRGFSNEVIEQLKHAYKVIYRDDLTVAQVLVVLEPMIENCPELKLMLDVLKGSERGIVR